MTTVMASKTQARGWSGTRPAASASAPLVELQPRGNEAAQQRLRAVRPTPGKLPFREEMETAFGADFGDVEAVFGAGEGEGVQGGGGLPDGAGAALPADAATDGQTVWFRGPSPSREEVAHELTHVMQHRLGGGVGVSSPEDASEGEARSLAKDAAAGKQVDVSRGAGAALHGDFEIPAAFKTPAEVRALDLAGFVTYADAQADWYTQPDLTDAVRDGFRTVLAFAREPDTLAGCSAVGVGELVDTGLGADVMNPLRTFNRACTEGALTVRIRTPPGDLATRIRWGEAIDELEAGISLDVLATCVPQAELELLLTHDLVTAFVDYVRDFQPVLQANNGSEVQSFVGLVVNDGATLSAYQGMPYVRNVHRFEKDALDAALANLSDTSGTRPLVLVLHSAMDHNGAFHRDPNMTAVLTDPVNLTILYEGAETLADVQAAIPEIAATYGPIHQAMFAGHGDARSIELAGTTTGTSWEDDSGQRHMETNTEDLDLNARGDQVDDLLETLLDDMATGTSDAPRVVFNACLTNSNSTDGLDLEGMTEDEAREAIRQRIATDGSLATHLTELAAHRGQAVESIGANGSIGQVGLIDGNHDLTITSPDDPAVTSSKIQYVETGAEPQGALRAVVECWADEGVGPQATFDAMARRLGLADATAAASYTAVAGTDWYESVIRALYVRILTTYRSSPGAMQTFAERTSFWLGEMATGETTYCTPSSIDGAVPATDRATLYPALATSNAYGDLNIQLPMLQAWLAVEPGPKSAELRTYADGFGRVNSCSEYGAYVGDEFLRPHYATLLPTATAGTDPGTAGLLFALTHVGRAGAGAEETTRTFLRTLAAADRAFPDTLRVTDMLAGFSTTDAILEAIGLGRPTVDEVNDGAEVEANLDTDGDGTNDRYIQPDTRDARVKASALNVRDAPSMRGRRIGLLHRGDTVHVSGTSNNWTAIEFQGKTGFVYGSYLE